MKLSALLNEKIENDVEVSGLATDSRAVKAGDVFFALAGAKDDGAKYIAEAKQKGAVAVVEGGNVREILAHAAARFYAKQPENIVAVTGTNGKTSTVHFTRQIWERLGMASASLGTLGLMGKNYNVEGSMTTPDPVKLHEMLRDCADKNITHLAMEASSHGLHQHRLDGVRLRAGAFSNLTRDHLDYHGDMEEYRRAKFRLFEELLPEGAGAVLNADSAEYAALEKICIRRNLNVISFGKHGQSVTLRNHEIAGSGQRIEIEYQGRCYNITLALAGSFQMDNILCALCLAANENIESREAVEKIFDVLPHLTGVPGRLQEVTGHQKGAHIYVDYAHTPDALEKVLKALRPHTTGKLFCIFGCGGDRDAGKRPLMAQVAASNADSVIVTDDNPRSENPADIRKQVLAGAPEAEEIGDRREAIQKTIARLQTGDVLVIAGKGHEQGQIFADHTENFCDVAEAEKALQLLQGNDTRKQA